MHEFRSLPKMAGWPDNRIIQDRIKEASLYHSVIILLLIQSQVK